MAKKGKKGLKKKRQPPSPACKAILLCERTIIEAGTGNVSLIGIFNRFLHLTYPTRTRQFVAFLQIVNALGRYDIIIEIHDLGEDKVIARANAPGINIPDRLKTVNISIPVPRLPLTHPGKYDLVIFANGQEIDRQQFVAAQLEEPNVE